MPIKIIYLSFNPPITLSVYHSAYPLFYLSFSLPILQTTYLGKTLSIGQRLSFTFPNSLCTYHSVDLSSICLSLSLPILHCAYLSVHLSLMPNLSTYPSVCLTPMLICISLTFPLFVVPFSYTLCLYLTPPIPYCAYPSVCLSLMSNHHIIQTQNIFVSPSVCLSHMLPIYLGVYPSDFLSPMLPIQLSFSLPIPHAFYPSMTISLSAAYPSVNLSLMVHILLSKSPVYILQSIYPFTYLSPMLPII